MANHVVVDQLSSPVSMIEAIKAQVDVTVSVLTNTGFCDYVWWDLNGRSITMERKTVQDLSGRVDDLERQLKKALKVADLVILLIEGIMSPLGGATCLYNLKNDGNIYYRARTIARPYQYYMGFLFRLWQLGIPVIFTSCKDATVETIVELVRVSNKPNTIFERYIKNKPVVGVQNEQVYKLMGLGLGEKRAVALIDRFKTVWNVLHATPEELATVDGIGLKTAQKLFEGVGK